MEENMFVPRQQYPRELKIALMPEIDSGKSTAWVARNYQHSPNGSRSGKASGGRKVSWRRTACKSLKDSRVQLKASSCATTLVTRSRTLRLEIMDFYSRDHTYAWPEA